MVTKHPSLLVKELSPPTPLACVNAKIIESGSNDVFMERPHTIMIMQVFREFISIQATVIGCRITIAATKFYYFQVDLAVKIMAI